MTSAPSTPVLIGREAELTQLLSIAARSSSQGSTEVALVRGEPGIGKTALLRSYCDSVQTQPVPTLIGYGQAMTHGAGSDAFAAIRECLRSLVRHAGKSTTKGHASRVADAFKTHAPDWLESVPMVGQLLAAGVRTGMAVAHSETPTDHLRSPLDQLVQFIDELIRQTPVILVLDDLHWTDSATVDVILNLALKVNGPLCLILSYRSDDLRLTNDGTPHPLSQAIYRLRRYRADLMELDLSRLNSTHIRQLVAGICPQSALHGRSLELLIEQSAGVPLYAESLALLGPDTNFGSKNIATPQNIKSVLDERLSYVPKRDQQLLEEAVIIGQVFGVDYLAEVSRVDLDDIYDRLDILLRDHRMIVIAESLGPHDRYSLYHPLLAEVLRGRAAANPPRWRRLHGRLLEVILAEEPRSDELAIRAAQTAAQVHDRNLYNLSLDAAARQYRAGAIDQARELATIAVDSADEVAEVLAAAELEVIAYVAQGNHQCAVSVGNRVLELAQESTGGEVESGKLALLTARNLRMINDWSAAENLLQEVLAQVAQESPLRAEAVMMQAEIALCGPQADASQCIALSEQVLGMTSDLDLQSRALGHTGLAYLAQYQPAEAETALRAAVAQARKSGHPYSVYEAIHWLSKKQIACLELVEAMSSVAELETISQSSGVATGSPFHQRDLSRIYGLQGQVPKAVTAFGQYLKLSAPAAHPRVVATLIMQVKEIEDQYGVNSGADFMEGFEDNLNNYFLDAESKAWLKEICKKITERPREWEPMNLAVARCQLAVAEVAAADGIFRFDVPDLSRLRRIVGSCAPPSIDLRLSSRADRS